MNNIIKRFVKVQDIQSCQQGINIDRSFKVTNLAFEIHDFEFLVVINACSTLLLSLGAISNHILLDSM
jgi:hypothetical protein